MLILIAAVAENGAIGKDNNLLCKVPGDLKRFKELTTGHKIIMGRKTLESFPKGPLPNRENIVLTRNKNYKAEGCTIIHEISVIDKYIASNEEVFVVGGEEIYKLLINKAEKMYLTHIKKKFDADAFFPDVNYSEWKVTFQEEKRLDSIDFDFTYVNYQRKS